MGNQKTAIVIFISCLVFYSVYYDNDIYEYNFENKNIIKRELMYVYTGSEDFLINTTNCYIPDYGKTLKFTSPKNQKKSCGERAIFIKRIANNKITFQIDSAKIKKYSPRKFDCCYRFVTRSSAAGKEDVQIRYSNCKPFKSSEELALSQEVITVTCTIPITKKAHIIIYEDAYIIVKKLTPDQPKSTEKSWNVLMLGMDTMSRARLLSTMPTTVKYLRKHKWLDYRGYQKVDSNTFPNLMAVLTGKKVSTVHGACVGGMHTCNDLIIWSMFRKAGYITAYGEDYLQLPDTFFNRRYKGFRTVPTQHYMRPLFLTGERITGNVICTKHLPSAKHILGYAHDFAETYKKEKFFGLFWTNSYSHNTVNMPSLFDNDVVDFFEKINKTGVMSNTFIILLSDHGIRFGPMRVPVESYYEERLPMFAVWVPFEFRKLHADKYHNLQLNQNRLVTNYDVYVTLTEISNMPKSSNYVSRSEACPQCTGLFEEQSEIRTCADAGVSDKWCSCHDMAKVDINGAEAKHSIQAAVSHIQSRVKTIETIDCKKCHSLQLDTVLRIHSYTNGDNKTFYVVAFRMTAGSVAFEATVEKYENEFTVLDPIDTISPYHGNCVKNLDDRAFCVCKSVKCRDSGGRGILGALGALGTFLRKWL